MRNPHFILSVAAVSCQLHTAAALNANRRSPQMFGSLGGFLNGMSNMGDSIESMIASATANAPAIPTVTAIGQVPIFPAITNEAQLNSSLAVVHKLPAQIVPQAYAALYAAIVPSPAPTTPQQLQSKLAAAQQARKTDLPALGADYLLSGVAGQGTLGAVLPDTDVFAPQFNSYTNVNPAAPNWIYPKSIKDAPYDQPEPNLRASIYIPPGFTYGKIKPVLFVPGTTLEAYENFAQNMGKLCKGSSYADPVYVNVPKNMLADVQTNAEFVAYAINYVASITGTNITVLSCSQGGPATQWALKYWPSTRKVVDDFIAVSPDFHGTVEAPLICPPGVPCDPAIIQQEYESLFITTLRANGGDAAYVPTTEIHSIFDEVVEPQNGPLASAFLNPGTHAGVTNVQIQSVCPPGTPAGDPGVGHEGSLYNPVTMAVAIDAIKHSGPADIARSGAAQACGTFFTNGLAIADVIATEALIPVLVYNLLTFNPKVFTEPPIKPYAAIGH